MDLAAVVHSTECVLRPVSLIVQSIVGPSAAAWASKREARKVPSTAAPYPS